MRAFPYAILTLGLAAGLTACSDNNTGPGDTSGFASIQAMLSAQSCRNCHNPNNSVYHGGFDITGTRTTDSLTVLNYVNYDNPASSPLIQRPLTGSSLDHPTRPFAATSDADVQTIIRYVQALAQAGGSRTLTAATTASAPSVDGVAESAWSGATPLSIAVHGGFAGDITVTMRAMYTPTRVFFLLQWDDPTESWERVPWLKTATGWLHEEVAPPTFDNSRLSRWRTPPDEYRYEDKLAIIWNTTGANAVDGFNENGCAVLCHVDRPGDARPLKYTNLVGETADMWHWKLVRTNVVHRLDDQYVYWNRTLSLNANGGRSGDPGGGEYKSNGTTGPAFTSANQPATAANRRYFMVDSATAAAWAAVGLTIDPNDIATAFTDTYAVGDQIAYAIATLLPNKDRSDVEAYGVYAAGKWTLEIARNLTTTSVGAIPAGGTSIVPVDVQFTPGQDYHFGVAVFNNAQIEHSWSPGVYTLRFQQ
jgi:hypothetical protein